MAHRRRPPAAGRLWTARPAAVSAAMTRPTFAPLFVTLGAAADKLPSANTVIDGFWHGLSKRSWKIG